MAVVILLPIVISISRAHLANFWHVLYGKEWGASCPFLGVSWGLLLGVSAWAGDEWSGKWDSWAWRAAGRRWR